MDKDRFLAKDVFGITDREYEVLELLRLGIASNKEIGKVMIITPRTVKIHKKRLFAKLGIVHDEDQDGSNKSIKAIIIGMKNGIIPEYLPRIDETKTQIFRDGAASLGIELDQLDLES